MAHEQAEQIPAEVAEAEVEAAGRFVWRLPFAGPAERRAAWRHMLLHDNGLLRLVLPNRHRVAAGVWRSGQPNPWQLRAFARAGGRTVVSLRAGRYFGALPLEIEASARLGLAFHVAPLRARGLPKPEQIVAFDALLRQVERPVLMHCNSGCDRTGLAAALYLMLIEGCDVARARRQLSLRYGHRQRSPAGILDAFLEAYQRDAAARPQGLLDWATTRYRPEAIKAEFERTRAVRRAAAAPSRHDR